MNDIFIYYNIVYSFTLYYSFYKLITKDCLLISKIIYY